MEVLRHQLGLVKKKVERESTFERVNMMTEKKIDDKIYSVNIIEKSNIIGDDDNEPIYEDQYSGCDNSTRRRTSVARGKKVTNKSSSTTPGGKLSRRFMCVILIGTDDKVEWVKKIGDGEKPCVVGLQETKLKEVDEIFVKRMWYDNNFGFAQVNSDGRSGGIITIWDSNIFIGTHAAGEEGFLAVVGKWKGVEGLLNVYGPRDEYKRLELWNRLSNVLGTRDVVWCIFGDFNEVRCPEERMNSQYNDRSARKFNEFIRECELIDVPMGGRRFMRISDDGLKFSKLDRFLVSGGFRDLWTDLSVVALDRKLSDHCLILLRDKVVDFGPKQFRAFDV
ncbi:RNA-directed DNA polymerase, eukaryota [Tanacetum coccineum]